MPVAPGNVCSLFADQKNAEKSRFPLPARLSHYISHFLDKYGDIEMLQNHYLRVFTDKSGDLV